MVGLGLALIIQLHTQPKMMIMIVCACCQRRGSSDGEAEGGEEGGGRGFGTPQEATTNIAWRGRKIRIKMRRLNRR